MRILKPLEILRQPQGTIRAHHLKPCPEGEAGDALRFQLLSSGLATGPCVTLCRSS